MGARAVDLAWGLRGKRITDHSECTEGCSFDFHAKPHLFDSAPPLVFEAQVLNTSKAGL